MVTREQFQHIVIEYFARRSWTYEELGVAYGNLILGRPLEKQAIYQLMKHPPIDPRRRWVLCQLLKIPPAALGLQSLDEFFAPHTEAPQSSEEPSLQAYADRLKHVRGQLDTGQISGLAYRMYKQLSGLYDYVSYRTGESGMEARRLLVHSQELIGEVFREIGRVEKAATHFESAIKIAKEEGFDDLLAEAYMYRGMLAGKFDPTSINYLSQALTYAKYTQPAVHADIAILKARSVATLAVERADMDEANHLADLAEQLLRQQPDLGSYYIDRADTFLSPKLARYRDPNRAMELVGHAFKAIPIKKRRSMSRVLSSEAHAYMCAGLYEQAIDSLRGAIEAAEGVSAASLLRAEEVYCLLKESPYRNSIGVEELELRLKLANMQ